MNSIVNLDETNYEIMKTSTLTLLSFIVSVSLCCFSQDANTSGFQYEGEEIQIDTYSSYTSSLLGSKLITFPRDGSYDSLIKESLIKMGLFNIEIDIHLFTFIRSVDCKYCHYLNLLLTQQSIYTWFYFKVKGLGLSFIQLPGVLMQSLFH